MATVDRVLPWRRHHETAASAELTPLLAVVPPAPPQGAASTMINRAYHMAAEAHRTQTRSSGESYINHPLAVATIVADIGLDDDLAGGGAAARRRRGHRDHAGRRRGALRRRGGPIVDGVTKLERIQFDSREAQQAATMRKMLVAMAKDLRVLVIKLADRLHNMRTIAGDADREAAAHRPGDARHLRAAGAPARHPGDQAAARGPLVRGAAPQALRRARPPRRHPHARARGVPRPGGGRGPGPARRARHRGRGHGPRQAPVEHLREDGRRRAASSTRSSTSSPSASIVDSIKDCYAALGSIHGRWRPVVGRFKDYIAMPKFNLYQSLHTTVIGPQRQGRSRSRSAPARCTSGPSGASPPTGRTRSDGDTSDIDWLNRIIDWQAEVSDPAQFMENLKTDLEQDEVFVFTPKGKVITLPVGSTPIDFAYAVHTEVGHRCIGSKVNGRLVPLDHKLRQRRHVRDLHLEGRDRRRRRRTGWGSSRRTARQNKIRQWFSRERRVDMIEAGRDELTEEFRRESLPVQKIWSSEHFAEVLDELSYIDLDTFLAGASASTTCRRAASPRRSRKAFHGGGTTTSSCPPPCSRRAGIGAHRRRGRGPRRGARRRARAARELLHPGARRRDHRVRHPRPRRQRAPLRLRQRDVARRRPGDAA